MQQRDNNENLLDGWHVEKRKWGGLGFLVEERWVISSFFERKELKWDGYFNLCKK